ncbi:hypothetical protein GE061_004873 [Apolygus lucorum]|uniref:ABC transporter domain-containing protein n=1 Tax=Apolygus lucorum TaxID=248454 RepID=A0A8S9X0E5_APOLU|nr:hypothetical protein GE061_004873 [Apolygus lucorum]
MESGSASGQSINLNMMEESSVSDFSGALDRDAVRVTDAYKKFGSKTYALRGLNMTVKQGTIYGLLGPSGCGKTTLLSCLIGRLKLDSGSVKLNIERTSQMGYMPQNLALFQEFSIKEHLMFYGYIHSMKKPDITEASEKLMEFLELPDLNTVVSSLSCQEYKDRDLRLAAARRISEAMGIPGFGPKGVIAKFKNLRSSYCQELKKIADSERSGTGTDDVYIPKCLPLWISADRSRKVPQVSSGVLAPQTRNDAMVFILVVN